jgi:hypothetical protein
MDLEEMREDLEMIRKGLELVENRAFAIMQNLDAHGGSVPVEFIGQFRRARLGGAGVPSPGFRFGPGRGGRRTGALALGFHVVDSGSTLVGSSAAHLGFGDQFDYQAPEGATPKGQHLSSTLAFLRSTKWVPGS